MHPSRPALALLVVVVALLATTRQGLADDAGAELSPQVVATFTRRVQPLLLNRCAAGACHGGPTAHAPRLDRGLAPGRVDRSQTLANLRTFLAAVGDDRDPRRLVTMLAARHPATPVRGGLSAAPLTAAERVTIESWLASVHGAERDRPGDSGVRLASAEMAVAAPRNPLRARLEAAANPPPLEPPSEPTGVIFPHDDGVSTEPPPAPLPP
ncbi:MAG: hypothetical protein ACKO4T_12615 [Planctomycetaceae bacterium]